MSLISTRGRIIMIPASVLIVVELEKYLLRKYALSKKGFFRLLLGCG
jgi:hypothetical protein